MSEAHLDRLGRWIETESFTRDRDGVNRMVDLVAGEASGGGIGVERIAGREGLGDCLVARAGPANSLAPVIVLSHLDTVHPAGTLETFPLRREGDLLFGPGTYDMKGGAYCALQALRAVAAARSAKRPVIHLFTPDEEIGSPTSRALIEDFCRGAAAVLVTEPARAGGRVVTSRKGNARFQVEIGGRAAHAGTHHELGRSAILEAAAQIGRIGAMTDYDGGVTTNVGLVSGGTASNVVAERCTFSVDLRFVSGPQGERASSAILGMAPVGADIAIAVTRMSGRPPYERSERVAGLFDAARAVAAGIGLDLDEAPRAGGGSDGNFAAALGVPTLDGLGVEGGGAHTRDEYLLVSSIAPRIALMKALLEQI